MKHQTKINLAFLSAIIAAICWLIGDIYLLGYGTNPDTYPLFSQEYADKVNVQMATMMLGGTTKQLLFGALIGLLTVPLYLPAVWLAYQFFGNAKKWYAILCYWLLLAGVTLQGFGHAAFFQLGEMYRTILHTDKSAHSYLFTEQNGAAAMPRKYKRHER